ncbi:MAG TPA: hypothetical protein VG323_08990 [Thermoanaerobaculia bacterium]|nr:hypothetical protein [Thermoanaerobaculia bacterium]
MTTFSIAAIDELWLHGTLAERRLMHGRAEQRGDEIIATDARDEALVARCERAMTKLRAAMPRDAERVRLVARSDSATMTVEIGGVSIVTTPEFVAEDVKLLRQPPVPCPLSTVPLLWHNGSAAVLLHEAFGHPLELGIAPVEWPSWLRVDCPMEMRRASFSDVPLRRMTRVVVSHENAPFALPSPRIDVHLVRGGAYDPLTDVVTIDVAVPRFTIRATRAEIASSIAGAIGEPIRYPGVVCSREGQELVVGSYAPVIVTRELS